MGDEGGQPMHHMFAWCRPLGDKPWATLNKGRDDALAGHEAREVQESGIRDAARDPHRQRDVGQCPRTTFCPCIGGCRFGGSQHADRPLGTRKTASKTDDCWRKEAQATAEHLLMHLDLLVETKPKKVQWKWQSIP